MSTRCQVQIRHEYSGWKEKVTLYHHWDGYPSNMVPLIASARQKGTKILGSKEWKKGDFDWLLYRAGHVAGLLCATDPLIFEPESGHQLHRDIEWYYKLNVTGNQGPNNSAAPWQLEVFHLRGSNQPALAGTISIDDKTKDYAKIGKDLES